MTLKQWLDSYSPTTPAMVKAYTSAYYQDQQAKAEAAFNAAFLKMQPQIPVIDERGEIEYRDGRKGTYAQNEDIQQAIGPILHKHGFHLTFETTFIASSAELPLIHVDGILTHKKGHSRRSSFESLADLSGGKTNPQSRASVVSFGHRYTTCDLLNIVTRGSDTDAKGVPYFDYSTLSRDDKGAFLRLLDAATGLEPVREMGETWGALTVEQRQAIGMHGFAFIKQFAHDR